MEQCTFDERHKYFATMTEQMTGCFKKSDNEVLTYCITQHDWLSHCLQN